MKIIIRGVIGSWDIDSQDVINQLNASEGDIEVEIDSIGGSVFHGVTIFNALKAYSKGKVSVIITGVAASIASYIALAGDEIKAYDNTTYMIHNAWLPSIGDYREHRKSADISESLSVLIAKAYISKTGMSAEEIKALMEDETFYYGDEILEAGFVDEMISTEHEGTKAEAMAMAHESLKACNNAVMTNENIALDAVAKLLPQENEPVVETKPKVVDLSAQQKRDRHIQILQKEITC